MLLQQARHIGAQAREFNGLQSQVLGQCLVRGQVRTITGQRGNAVLIGEEDWLAIQETLFLESVPGLADSIRRARAEGVDAGSTELDW